MTTENDNRQQEQEQMQSLSEILNGAELKRRWTHSLGKVIKPFDSIEVLNSAKGKLGYYDCEKCKNKGVIYYRAENGEEVFRDCECLKIRDSIRLVEKSGLKNVLKKYTFRTFKADTEFTRYVYAKAQAFFKEVEKNTDEVKWFYFGGQVGCGKTHICTAIVGELLTKQNKPTLYMQWREDVTNLKANVMNAYEYEGKMKAFKTVDVLYIDDLFKTEKGKTPTTADINIAFEILNYRYNQKDLITVISSEKTAFDLLEIDEAVASRIIENARNFRIDVKNDKTKNFRLRNLFNGCDEN